MKCSHCGQPTLESTPLEECSAPGRAVARVKNLAEAGYLVSLLEAEGIEAVVHPVESFNAISGMWTHAHQLSVAEDRALDAARLLRLEANAREAGRPAAAMEVGEQAAVDADPAADSANLARPLTLLLVVAAVAWGLFGRNGAARNAPAEGVEPAAALGPALRSLGQPLYAADGPNRPRHRFRFDSETGCWELASDADRDGVYERSRRFQAAHAN